GLPICLFFFGSPLCVYEIIQVGLELDQAFRKRGVALVVSDPGTRSGCEVKVRHVDQTLSVAGVPRWTLHPGEPTEILDHARAPSCKGNAAVFVWFREVQFGIRLAEWRANRRQ